MLKMQSFIIKIFNNKNIEIKNLKDLFIIKFILKILILLPNKS